MLSSCYARVCAAAQKQRRLRANRSRITVLGVTLVCLAVNLTLLAARHLDNNYCVIAAPDGAASNQIVPGPSGSKGNPFTPLAPDWDAFGRPQWPHRMEQQ